jgi:hypothetical protein
LKTNRTPRRMNRIMLGLVAVAAAAAAAGPLVSASAAPSATKFTIRDPGNSALQANIGNNSPVVFGFADGTANSQWEKRPSPTNSAYDVWFHRGSGRCLDVLGDSQSAGAKIVVRACDGTISQDWHKQIAVFGTRPFVNRNSKLLMTQNGSITQQPKGAGGNTEYAIKAG